MTNPPDSGDAGPGEPDDDGFERWLTSKSFSMLVPMCRLGLVVVLVMLLVVDPILYRARVWGANPQHFYLVSWHICAVAYFLVFLFAARYGVTHPARKRLLAAFLVTGTALFSWFAFISWMLSGDFSIYATFLLAMVCVFSFPSHLRKILNIASAAVLVALIFQFDQGGIFYVSGAAMNLLALTVVAILLDGFLINLNRALHREKRLVEYERARADRVLYNALPVSIANELKNNNTVKAEKFQRMTVLFVDIVGFTRFSAIRAPDVVVQVLNDIFSEFDALVDRYDVEKIKTIGDAYMVVGKGNASSVANLAMEMLGTMQAYDGRTGFGLAIRCGIHVGPAVAGVIGLKRFLYDVWGDAVNTASRMESMGEAGRIHVSEEVFKTLESGFDFAPRGEIPVKGKGLMRTYFLLGRRSANTQTTTSG